MDKFSENTIKLLKNNALIVDVPSELINDSSFMDVVDSYQKNGYLLTEQTKDFLKYFSNKKIVFKTEFGKDEIHFKTKKVLKSTIRNWEETYGMKSIVPLGLVYTEHMVFFCDEKGWTYAGYDYFVALFGYTPFEGLNNLLSNHILQKFDFDNRDRSIDHTKLFKISFESSSPCGRLVPEYDLELEEFTIKGECDNDGIYFDIGGQISFSLNEQYVVEDITYSLAKHHHDIVSSFPPYIVEEDTIYDLKVHKESIYEYISFDYPEKKCICDSKAKNFMLLLKPQEIYYGKQISKQTIVFITKEDEFVGFKITI